MSVRTTIKIPSGYTYERRQEIAARIIDYIKIRTLSGFDKNLRPFKPYNLEYAKKKGVSIYDVDLKLYGTMLDAMRIMKITRDEITIGYDGRTKEDKKAEGNILGTYGQPISNPDKVRDFLGIDAKALRDILKEFPLSNDEVINDRIDSKLDSLLSSINDETFSKWKIEQLADIDFKLPSWLKKSS